MSNINNTPATKEDVKQIVTESLGEFAEIMSKSFGEVNKRFEKIDQRFEDVYEYIDKTAKETSRHFDVVAENIHVDTARANKDEILSIKQRVEVLEEKVGV